MQKLIANETAYRTLAIWTDGGRLPHAILIEGERGSGRTSFARTIAAAALCEGAGPKPCGECRHCRKVENGIHPDVAVYRGEGGARSFHIDTVREIRANASVRPNEAEGRVFLLLEAQEMSVQAQNALLKTIEEPVAGVTFVLTCENRNGMLPTIRSRTALITLRTPSVEECAAYLPERVPDCTGERCLSAATEADGNVGTALALLQEEEGGGRYDTARSVLHHLLRGEELEALELLQAFERDRDGFAGCLRLMRGAAARLATGRESGFPGITPLQLGEIIVIMDETADALNFNANGLLITTAFAAKIRSVLAT